MLCLEYQTILSLNFGIRKKILGTKYDFMPFCDISISKFGSIRRLNNTYFIKSIK